MHEICVGFERRIPRKRKQKRIRFLIKYDQQRQTSITRTTPFYKIIFLQKNIQEGKISEENGEE
jgi:hypothetical protein